MEFTGRIEFISGVELIGDKQHEKQFVILTDEKGQYPNKVKIEGFNKTEEFQGLRIGEMVTAVYNGNVNEWKGKYFGSLNLYKFKTSAESTPVTTSAPEAIYSAPVAPVAEGVEETLPF